MRTECRRGLISSPEIPLYPLFRLFSPLPPRTRRLPATRLPCPGVHWEPAGGRTDFQNFHQGKRSRKVSTPLRQAGPNAYKRTGCATTARLPVAAALLHITGCSAASYRGKQLGRVWCSTTYRPFAFLRSVYYRKTVFMEKNICLLEEVVIIFNSIWPQP